MTKRTKRAKTNQTHRTLPERLPFVSTREVARALGRTQKNVRELMQKGQLPGRKLGGRWGMRRAEFVALVGKGDR